jgi:hypothetical protein
MGNGAAARQWKMIVGNISHFKVELAMQELDFVVIWEMSGRRFLDPSGGAG